LSAIIRENIVSDVGSLDHQTFRKFAELVYTKAGITLGPNKEALVHARLGKRMRQLGIEHFKDYYAVVEADKTDTEIILLLDAIATNVTHFFREQRHFEFLAGLLKQWEAEGQTKFRIWCAASSSGEEPYSIAITAREALRDVGDTRILASDISTKILAEARAGIYEERDAEKLSRAILNRYFQKQRTPAGIRYQVTDETRRLVTFARLNLATPPFPMKGPFDVIFCRNVMIYFDNTVRKRLLDHCHKLLKPGGYLMVGHAESLSGMLSHFQSVEPAVYIKG
jgi:chemotaxis protein methyltransferase CheR